MSRSFPFSPSRDRVEMNQRLFPSALKHGSASTPSPANGGSSGADQPSLVQRLSFNRQPENCFELRTK